MTIVTSHGDTWVASFDNMHVSANVKPMDDGIIKTLGGMK